MIKSPHCNGSLKNKTYHTNHFQCPDCEVIQPKRCDVSVCCQCGNAEKYKPGLTMLCGGVARDLDAYTYKACLHDHKACAKCAFTCMESIKGGYHEQ
jgi:hypothetical protein